MTPEQKLQRLGLELPPAPKPVGSYVPAVRAGSLIFTAGQIPTKDGRLISAGKVPTEVSLEDAQAAARQAVLNALAAVMAEAGTLEAIARVVRMNVFVNSAPGFTDQAKVANGASDLLRSRASPERPRRAGPDPSIVANLERVGNRANSLGASENQGEVMRPPQTF